jgi:hypothetical protein
MALIDQVYNKILENKRSIFDFNKLHWHNFAIDRIKSLCFLGQIDKNILYIAQLHQVIAEPDLPADNIRTLTIDEANEFYLTGEICSLPGYRPYAWAFWSINLETKYITVFSSYYNDMRKTPKDNYAIAYEQSAKNNKVCEFYAYKHQRRAVFKRLIEIVEYSKTNMINYCDFDKKVYQDMRKYFGMINNKNFINDEYLETNRPELIQVSKQQFIPYKIYNDMDLRSKLQGNGYLEIKFDTNGIIRIFNNLAEMNNYLYSLIKYVNENNKEFDIKQKITSLEKHYLSNKWPIPIAGATEEEIEENRKNYTLYKVSAQKFGNKVIVQADVQEYGIVYILTNYWENKYIDFRVD